MLLLPRIIMLITDPIKIIFQLKKVQLIFDLTYINFESITKTLVAIRLTINIAKRYNISINPLVIL